MVGSLKLLALSLSPLGLCFGRVRWKKKKKSRDGWVINIYIIRKYFVAYPASGSCRTAGWSAPRWWRSTSRSTAGWSTSCTGTGPLWPRTCTGTSWAFREYQPFFLQPRRSIELFSTRWSLLLTDCWVFHEEQRTFLLGYIRPSVDWLLSCEALSLI